MTARTRKATAAKTTTAKAPAKKTAAKAPAKAPAKETAPRKPATDRPGTTVDSRKPLTVRRRLFVGPMGPTEQAAIRAALAAASTRIPVPVRAWNGSTANLADGTLLIHNPGPDRIFTAHIACRHGAIHGWPITTHTDLREARAVTHACERDHTTQTGDDALDWDKAITRGVGPVATPKPSAVHALREGVRRAEATKADTQPLTHDDIHAGLAERATATEPAKEHPQP
ncbi:hypothetical protein ACFV0T_26505 [Streptomyces sp. NPDC059582]|uniref:hypothetical protein n=1 Tax=Streptomyces sp. NPDC059582 TaxID=3346875 RepID=UPI003678FF4F